MSNPDFSLNSSGSADSTLLVTPKKFADNAIAVEEIPERKILRGDVPIIDMSCVGVGSAAAAAGWSVDCIIGWESSAELADDSSIASFPSLAERSLHVFVRLMQ